MNFIDTHTDPWRQSLGEDGPQPQPQPYDHALLSIEQWHAVRTHWPSHLRVGLALHNTFDVQSLGDDLPRLTLITLEFPKWTDGRAYSQARTLRARLGLRAELRAVGDVVVDMVPLLARTGFDAVALRSDQLVSSAQRALTIVKLRYQADGLPSQPATNPSPSGATHVGL